MKKYLLYLGVVMALLSSPNESLSQTFEPNWKSLRQNGSPEWFRDAKFGIWAHWGPQSVPGLGDWYARQLYGDREGLEPWEHNHARTKRAEHETRYGHPSVFGFKDVINLWHAEKFDPDQLMDLYVRAGAKYFVSMGAHSDNFDLWDSKFQSWNATKVGPRKNVLGLWRDAARKRGIRFGVSIHSNWAWRWGWVWSQSDNTGPFKGVPYDGNLTAADGKGTWWEGLDPQMLYLKPRSHDQAKTDEQADPAFVDNFKSRVIDVIDRYEPDLLYFDWGSLPFGDTGLQIAAHFYNQNAKTHGGISQAVLNIKHVPDENRMACVLDIERGQASHIEKWPYQTDTCFGDWFYKKGIKYKTAKQVIDLLADIVSKNGTLLLNVPQHPDGTIDPELVASLEAVGKWLARNGDAIYASRPWKTFGEGPTEVKGGMFNEQLDYSPLEVRYTTNKGHIYAILFGRPGQKIELKSLGELASPEITGIERVKLLGHDQPLKWTRTASALVVEWPESSDEQLSYCLEITPAVKP